MDCADYSDWSVAYRHFDNNTGAADGPFISFTSSSIGSTSVDFACTKVLQTGPQTPAASSIVVSLILLLGIRVVSDKVAVIIAVYGFLGNRHFECG